jgi:hypothetical protein
VLQPSQVPTYILFMTFIVFLIVLFIAIYRWALRKRIHDMRQSPDFTEQDVIAVRNQMLALMIGVPLFLLFLFLSPLGWNLRQPFVFFLAFIIGFAPLAYISVSSIQNRVSIFQARKGIPIQGTKAVWSGVINLAFIILVFTAFAVYFASLK